MKLSTVLFVDLLGNFTMLFCHPLILVGKEINLMMMMMIMIDHHRESKILPAESGIMVFC